MRIALGIIVLLLAGPAAAQSLELRGSLPASLETQAFGLETSTTLSVEAVGIRRKFSESMHAEGWIINADSGEVVWRHGDQPGVSVDGDRYLFAVEGELTLGPGHYVAYLYTGGSWVVERPFRSLGSVLRDMADVIRRDDPGQDRDRYVRACRLSLRAPVGLTDRSVSVSPPGRLVLAPMSNEEYREAFFKVERPSRIRVEATGELDRDGASLWDLGWIEQVSTGETIWVMTADRAAPAGGAEKNVVCRETVELAPGLYRAGYAADSSHGWEDWNMCPPHDPRRWGLIVDWDDNTGVTLLDPNAPAPATPGVLVRWVRVGDEAALRKDLHLDRPERVRIHAMGEGEPGRFYDGGRLIETATGRVIWELTWDGSKPAGGARKNRVATAEFDLPAGAYHVLYNTDGSHAFGSWNGAPPREPYLYGLVLHRVLMDTGRN